jgi:hypothetical protein
MQIPDASPEEIIAQSEAIASAFASAGLDMPPNIAAFGAAMMMTFIDIARSGCECENCVNARQILESLTAA